MRFVDSLVPLAGVLSGTAICVLGVATADALAFVPGVVIIILSLKWWHDAYSYE